MKITNINDVTSVLMRAVFAASFLLIIHSTANAQAYTPQEQTCYNLVQGKVAWNTTGNTSWSDGNVRDLCTGTTDAAATVSCFRAKMPGLGWSEATKQCAAQNQAPAGQTGPVNAGGATTTRFPGKAMDIDAKNGAVWIVGNTSVPGGYAIYKLIGASWVAVDGGAVKIAIDNTGNPWVINDAGTIFRRANEAWTTVAAPNGARPIDIAISNSGEVWIAEDNGSVARWTGTAWTNLISQSAKSVVYLPQQEIFQIIDTNGRVFVRQAANSWVASTDATGLAAKYLAFAVDTDGTGWGIDPDLAIDRISAKTVVVPMPTPPVVTIAQNIPPAVAGPTPADATITRPAQAPSPAADDPADQPVPNKARVITTWNKAGYFTHTRVYRLDKQTAPVLYATDGPTNHGLGESPKITVGPEVPMSVPLQARVYTVVGVGEAVESYRGTIGANIDTGCFSARGTTMKPIVEPCPDGVSVESKHITFANEAGFTSTMSLSYYVEQIANGLPMPVQKTVDTGLTALGYRRKLYIPEDALPNMPVTLSIKAWGTNRQDLYTEIFDMTRKESPCYMVNGLLLTPSYETCTGDDAFLTDEKRDEYEKYERQPPVLSDAEMQQVMKWIAARMTAQLSPFCWKPIYPNGAGYPLSDCSPGNERVGVLCYPKCRAGYTGSLDRCGSVCPSGFADIGFFCQKPGPYGRGGGYAWIWGDPAFDYSKARARCEKDNPQGCETDAVGVLWYPKCKAGFHNVGNNICSPDCPTGWNDTGIGCTKPTYYRGAGSPMGCGAGYEQSGALCYPACRAGYQAVATNCTLKCPSQQPWDCGAACSTDRLECGLTVANQVISPILLVVTIATLGTDEIVEAPIKDAALGAEQAAITAAKGTSKLKNAFQLVKTSLSGGKAKIVNFLKSTQAYRGLAANFIGKEDALALKGPIVSAIGGETEFYRLFQQTPNEFFANAKLTLKVGAGLKTAIMTIKHDVDAYNMLFADNFEHNTTKEINDMINARFPNPVGRYQVKKQWAMQNLGMLLDATLFNQMQSSIGAGSIIDPSGLFSVVSAYLHPMCGEDVPFPAQLKLLHNR